MAEEFSAEIRLSGEIEQGKLIDVKVKIRHASRTGLQLVEEARNKFERFVRAEPAVFVKTVEVFYGADTVSTFEMNSSTSDNPLLAFKLKADKEAPVRAVVTNHKGQTVEATADVKFAS